MDYFLRFQHLWIVGVALLAVVMIACVRYFYYTSVMYRHSLGHVFRVNNKQSHHSYRSVFYGVRLISLIILALLMGKPQVVDSRSNIIIDGIDIMLVLDVSGSMQFQDYGEGSESRFDVAKREAVRFINKRTNDALGLVFFGKDAISRCPLTHDKKILQELVGNLELGDIDPDGTMLATGMVTGINRLKNSTSKTKVMILLTDGEPSDGDMDPNVACRIAKKLGVKIYTIGIGSDKSEVFMHPLYGYIQKPKVNVPLLQKIARETDGTFFMAHNAKDMRKIYDTIDTLERSKHESPLYNTYYDIYWIGVLVLLALCVGYLLVSTFIWFGL